MAQRRPLEDWELPLLRDLGSEIREARIGARLTQAELAESAEITDRHLRAIEAGATRTRRSTLGRLARTISECMLGQEITDPDYDVEPEEVDRDAALLLGELITCLQEPGTGRTALADESAYAERTERRRHRRAARKANELRQWELKRQAWKTP